MSRYGQLTEERVRKIATPDLTINEVAVRLAVQPANVRIWAKRLGLTLRPNPGGRKPGKQS
jgi:hypothetical protein